MNDKNIQLYKSIYEYIPYNDQEKKDKNLILEIMNTDDNLFVRDPRFHFTSSAWIVNRNYTKVLFVYHNIYDSWSWVGGHSDNDENLFRVAEKEAYEETGIDYIEGSDNIFSLEILPVSGHIKRGEYISSHLHLNLTYLFYADENSHLRVKPDENAGVQWIDIDDVEKISNEKWMIDNIYTKLIRKMKEV